MNRIYFNLFIIYLILLLIISKVIKIKRKNKATAIGSMECDYSRIFIGVALFLVAVISFKSCSDYRKVYENDAYLFYMVMVQVLAGILYVITSFDRTIICEDHIYFNVPSRSLPSSISGR